MTATGRTLGNYVLGSLLGRGGTSEVYAAEHRYLGDAAAVKILRSHLVDSDEATEAFLAEARRTRAIQHPNVVRVLDFGVDSGVLYLVMERIAGATLAARLGNGRLDEATVRRLGAGIADGMAAAHELGIVHRDLKPANVMLVDDVPKVVDFGIARHLDKAIASGPRMGTPAYMAPEQVVDNIIAPAVDVWALGVILFEALTGRLPFDTSGGGLPQLAAPPPRPIRHAACSPALEALIVACLQKEPRKRPASMAAIASALRGAIASRDSLPASSAAEGRGLIDERITQPVDAPLRQPVRRRLPIAIGAAAGAAIAATAIAVVVWQVAAREPAAAVAAEPKPVTIRAPVPAAPSDAAIAQPLPAPRPPAPALLPPPPPADAGVAAAVPAKAKVVIRSKPAGATIVIGGKRRGRTPATLQLALPVEIELRRAGFRTARARATDPGRLDVKLAPIRPRKPPCPAPPCEGLD